MAAASAGATSVRDRYKKPKDNGDVWGHFIKVVEFSSAGHADDHLCNFDELGNCIAVLVE